MMIMGIHDDDALADQPVGMMMMTSCMAR
jgi:hypothetical protein